VLDHPWSARVPCPVVRLTSPSYRTRLKHSKTSEILVRVLYFKLICGTIILDNGKDALEVITTLQCTPPYMAFPTIPIPQERDQVIVEIFHAEGYALRR